MKGRTLDDYINVRLDDDQLKGSEAGKKIYQTNLYHYAGTGHLAVDYARLMRLGFDGLLERAKQKLAALDMHDPEFAQAGILSGGHHHAQRREEVH